MDYRRKFLTAFGLILLLLVGKIAIFDEDNVEESRVEELEIKSLKFENDICSLYDNSKVIDSMLFERKYKPLVVIIAANLSIGINRVRNLSGSKRILNDDGINNNPHYSQLYQIIMENIYLFQANDTYYFVYPLKLKLRFLTIYCQNKLLNDNLGITFDFVNVKKDFPFYEDILISLEPSCTNCTLVNYVNEKLQKGERFSELLELRKQLFREQETKNLSFGTFDDNDNVCTSMGFNLNSQNANSLMSFNSLLNQIQSNSKSIAKIKKRIVEKSLICFQSRNSEATEHLLSSYGSDLKNVTVMIDYLNWIYSTTSSLNNSDISFGILCENKHKIEILDLFCFMKKKSDVTSHNVTAWIDALKQHVAKTLKSKLKWFNSLMSYFNYEYTMSENQIFYALNYLKNEMLTVSENWSNVMNIAYNNVKDSLSANNNNSRLINNTICTIYKHWKTINDLLFDVKFKRLVIIVTDNIRQGIKTFNQIRTSRIVPKVKREDLHYSEQFLYDFIMKHIYLVQSNDTHYYVYPTTTSRQENPLIGYFEYKMIKDYSKVEFLFVNFLNYFSLDEQIILDYNYLVIPALPDFCNITSRNCKTRFVNPSYLLKVHQEFFNRFPKYFSLYASFYLTLTEFINNHNPQHKDSYYIEYSRKFYEFLGQKQISYNINYLFRDLPCLSLRELNLRTDMDFSITKLNDALHFDDLLISAYTNIISINNGDNTNLKSLCSKKEIFKFLKFFCFLKINFIDDMLKVIDQESNYISNMKSIVENEENDIIKYFLKTMGWIQKLLSMNNNDYQNNETRMFNESDALYSQIPKITFNGADLSNKIYSIFKNNTIFLQCQKLGFVDTEEITVNVVNASTKNYLVLSENKTSPKFQETDLINL
ncbi:uncharacterized protein LOC122510631 [Leptopilina heterotoma]|uniref:uncharacterized protein LOC122510631 n=1 Tax=Leptopilina heterotoma TaxID=63436 RepID=UPI001CA90509|nr:uncharacterized protein LOC122510631 [Leptopilina heterotoma]